MSIEEGTLVHYHSDTFELDRTWDYCAGRQRTDKPTGLWVSVAGSDDWESWCRSEDYGVEHLAAPHVVTLADSAKILRIESAAALLQFDSEYGLPSRHGTYSYRFDVDWPRLYGEYDGIIIAPYQWSQRYEGPQWYYGWDCASGCIWNLNAIASFEAARVSA